MLHGLTNGAFHDEKRFWPIFERAEKLDVPVYSIGNTDPTVIERYYKDYVRNIRRSSRPAGAGVEIGTAAVRMVLPGVFRQCPNLKIIVGHLGEGLPFLLHRLDECSARRQSEFRGCSSEAFLGRPAAISDPALLCTVQELGIDRILFSVVIRS